MKCVSRQPISTISRKRKIRWLALTRQRSARLTQNSTDETITLTRETRASLDYLELYNQAREAAILQERQRLARELHDSVTQELYGICLAAATASEALENEIEEVRAQLTYISQHAHVGLAELRTLLFELRPASLETGGLIMALRNEVAMLRERYQLNVETELGGEPDLSPDKKQSLYRVAQEALRNVIKHAQASIVTLKLIQEGHELLLEVRDNGRGFDLNQCFPGHMGLQSMQERMQGLKVAWTIDSTPGKGTVISARLPVN